MPEISLTEDQHEQLEAIRADVEDAFVDGYGHARLEDAIDYLLDTYTPPNEQGAAAVADGYDLIATAEYPQLQHVAAEVPDIPGSGIDADEMRGKLLAELGPEELAERLAEQDVTGEEDAEVAAPAAGEQTGTGAVEDSGTEGDSKDSAADDADEEPVSSETIASENGADSSADPLAGVNKLLREHDDKWRKADSGDEPYEVDLPDGTTEGVRTKDDVRQYLFRHY